MRRHLMAVCAGLATLALAACGGPDVRDFVQEAAINDIYEVEAGHLARAAGLPALAAYGSKLGAGLRLSPLETGTDGFYIAALARS